MISIAYESMCIDRMQPLIVIKEGDALEARFAFDIDADAASVAELETITAAALATLDVKDEELLRKSNKCRSDKASIMHQIKECQDPLSENNHSGLPVGL